MTLQIRRKSFRVIFQVVFQLQFSLSLKKTWVIQSEWDEDFTINVSFEAGIQSVHLVVDILFVFSLVFMLLAPIALALYFMHPRELNGVNNSFQLVFCH